MNSANRILIVDDAETNRLLLRNMLEAHYEIVEACDGHEAVNLISRYGLGLSIILLDMIMPEMDGYQVLDYMNHYGYIDEIPVICITSDLEPGKEEKAFDLGVSDFIPKPFNVAVVQKRIQNTIDLYNRTHNLQNLVEEQTAEICAQTALLQEQAIQNHRNDTALIEGLSTLVEFRDYETNQHLSKMKHLTNVLYSHIMMRDPELQIQADEVETVTDASILHDIGKIAIPDQILLKPGKLTAEEFEIMKGHARAGARILEKFSEFSDTSFMQHAREICLHHHERIDGNGYPDGLKGDEIPLYVQVVSLADVYDALVSPRVYKPACSHEQAIQMILNNECGAFSDSMKEALINCSEQIRE